MQVVRLVQPARRRSAPATLFVVHGSGETSLQKCLDYYTTSKGVRPQYLVTGDQVYQFVEDDRVAGHAGFGSEQEELYRAGWDVWSRRINEPPWRVADPWPGYTGWRARWPDLASPLDLLPPGRGPNDCSIGVEVLSLEHQTPRVFGDGEYELLRELLRAKGAEHGIPLTPRTVLGHSDVNPISRCNARGSYDPGERFDWGYVLG